MGVDGDILELGHHLASLIFLSSLLSFLSLQFLFPITVTESWLLGVLTVFYCLPLLLVLWSSIFISLRVLQADGLLVE